MDLKDNTKPLFGIWSYDSKNRHKFDSTYKEPPKPKINNSKHVQSAQIYVEKHFSKNFGDFTNFIYPVDFSSSKKLLNKFIKNSLITFGKYEDASDKNIPFGSHSLLSSSINIGLISVQYIVKKIINKFNKLSLLKQKQIINSVEGFIRQIIGWRSYVRFIYKFHGATMYKENRLAHTNKVSSHWFDGTTNIPPIDNIINKVHTYAYAHHIERLMFLGNFALISQINPQSIYKWFMICFIDSYEWVMIPNIMGMSQYSSKSIQMMTRPYVCSSNYIKTMSNYKTNSYDKISLDKEYYWNEILDSLYYNFINTNKKLLSKIYSTAILVKHFESKNPNEKNKLSNIAKQYISLYK